jgi:hypothetical protein
VSRRTGNPLFRHTFASAEVPGRLSPVTRHGHLEFSAPADLHFVLIHFEKTGLWTRVGVGSKDLFFLQSAFQLT